MSCTTGRGERPAVSERPGDAAEARGPGAQGELDRTLWDCEWNMGVFWGPRWYRVHRDVAMAAMGGEGTFSREDYELSYGPRGRFSAALRHVEYPGGQREPEDFRGPPLEFRYTLARDQLTIRTDAWDEPLVCTRSCYNDEFIRFMDAHYGVETEPASVAQKRVAPGAPGCGPA